MFDCVLHVPLTDVFVYVYLCCLTRFLYLDNDLFCRVPHLYKENFCRSIPEYDKTVILVKVTTLQTCNNEYHVPSFNCSTQK